MKLSIMSLLAGVGLSLLAGCAGEGTEDVSGGEAAATAARCMGGPEIRDEAGNVVAQARCIPAGIAAPHAYVEMKTARSNQPFFVVRVHDASVARNDRDTAILVSETYGSKAAREKGLGALSRAARESSAFDVRTNREGTAYFVVKAANGEVVATSGTYADKRAAEAAVASTKAAFKQKDLSIGGEESDLRSQWASGDETMMLRAGNGKTMLTVYPDTGVDQPGAFDWGKLYEKGFTAHELGASSRLPLLSLAKEKRKCTDGFALAKLTENAGIEHVFDREGQEERFYPVILDSNGDPIAVGTPFDNCKSAIDSLERITRILDLMPRG